MVIAPDQFSLKVASRREDLPRIVSLLNDLRAIGRLPEGVHHRLCVVVDEIVNNLLTHALRGHPGYEIGMVVQIYTDRVELEICDDGPPFNPIAHDTPTEWSGVDQIPVGGLGLHLAKSLVDEMLYRREDGRNHLRVTKNISRAEQQILESEADFGAARGEDRRRPRAVPIEFPIIVRGERIEHDRRLGDRRHRRLDGHVALFHGVDSPDLEGILAECPVLDLAETRILIRKGEKNEYLYILLAGELQVQLDLNDPSPIRIQPGESVGEISLIDGEPTSAYVVAKPGARLIVVADRVFWEKILPLPGVARNLMRAQTRRMRANNESILAKLKHELLLQQMEKDLSIAAEIQSGMLPRNFPLFPDRTEIDLHATMIPAREVGGDFYDAFLTDHGDLVFAVGDVSGKGVAAALFMVRSMTLLRTEARHANGPVEMLQRINRLLCEENPQSMFVTLCLGVLELESGLVRIGNAGHLPPVLGAADGWKVLPPARSSLLGIWESGDFAETELRLEAGQTLVLYSDGVTEAHPAVQSDRFGDGRLVACLPAAGGAAREIVERVIGEVSRFAAGDEPFDDLTVLALRYNGTSGGASRPA